MLSNWMSICLYQYLKDSAGEPLYKLFKAIKHQVEKGPVDAVQKKAKYTLNDTGLLGDDVEYAPLVSPGAGQARWWDWTQGQSWMLPFAHPPPPPGAGTPGSQEGPRDIRP
ncbi:plexin-B2-like [Pteropus vampyrus]|uniref:Plexin-B2-like n=1 Tax=Pteropus vampyrus TaxID=132908 RepID=A0A6P6C594_PTEVA|nr:plexin-B2-like [Pteropus vampyrus]